MFFSGGQGLLPGFNWCSVRTAAFVYIFLMHHGESCTPRPPTLPSSCQHPHDTTNQNNGSLWLWMGFPCGSDGKESTCYVGDLGSVPGLGRSPGEGNDRLGAPRPFWCDVNII